MLSLVQLSHPAYGRHVALVSEPHLRVLRDCASVFELATSAIEARRSLRESIEQLASDERIAYDEVYEGRSEWRLLPPIDHPEPSRCWVTGTGLTHKGSAENRQSMHAVVESQEPTADGRQPISDSMKMFQLGLAAGRPEPGCIGAAPEWFYKGTGSIVRAHEEPLDVPAHALDGGEEAEIAGVYLIGPDGAPYRVGMAQANEFSDHVLEARNYLYLAESKLRDCALGPELIVEPKFDDVPGRSTIERGAKVIWEAPQASGERWMCHSLANLEHHHFKHQRHRRPGDVHIHFFGADKFSFKDRLVLEDDDVMSIAFANFGRSLRNVIRIDRTEQKLVSAKLL